MAKFDNCDHVWEFHVSAGTNGVAFHSTYYCNKCSCEITLEEKCALEQVNATNKSLIIQERQTRTGMRANIISAGVLIIAFITLLFGDKILNCLK